MSEKEQENVTKPLSRDEVIKSLQEQIEVRSLHSQLQKLNTELTVDRFRELEAQYNISKILEATQQRPMPQQEQDKYIEHVVTQEDLDLNSHLVEEGIKVGQTIAIPRESIKAVEELPATESQEQKSARSLKVSK